MDSIKDFYDPHEEPWRVFRIMAEFVDGFEELKNISPAISIFGSARTPATDHYYQQAEKFAFMLGKAGYNVITGGGPGIMEAANKGAKNAEVISVGLNIDLPMEQEHNPYITRLVNFKYFFIRKVMFTKYALGSVFFPGGFGTLDELAEVLTLIQTNKMRKMPVIIIGRAYWQSFLDFLSNEVLAHKNISAQDLELYTVTDDLDQALAIINDYVKKVQ
ncbi:MAG: TIGR00730 family Rossman fold protein [Spirochaetae bacterium HGW-Spirochaetae-6]|jgi:hypothetical protein|nr:MAG: TIGR00730 family Rossman fold protein [Spirochaetae bacterium HGW-Spirochaetae-6]